MVLARQNKENAEFRTLQGIFSQVRPRLRLAVLLGAGALTERDDYVA
jgi:hypothetical protein